MTEKSINIIFDIIKNIFLILLLIITLYPFVNIIALSFNDAGDSIRGGIKLWPRVPTLHNYVKLLSLRNGFLDKKEKNKAREAVRKVNSRADEFIQQSFTVSINLHGSLTNIAMDINAAHPKMIANAMFLQHKKEEMCQGLEESVQLFGKYIKLLKIFAVHVDQARKSFQEKDA